MIFSFDSDEEKFNKYLHAYKKRDLTYQKENEVPEIIEEGEIYLKDNIIIEKTPMEKYLENILSILEEFSYIKDISSTDLSKKCFALAEGEIKKEIIGLLKDIEADKIDNLLPELIFLNRLLVDTEIQTGILFCDNCNRWYPIIDTIPRMLPDKYRSKEKDLKFLEEHKDSLKTDFLKKDLKPFSLES
jgi:uncharacterized protein YbaR (Trm112 family)